MSWLDALKVSLSTPQPGADHTPEAGYEAIGQEEGDEGHGRGLNASTDLGMSLGSLRPNEQGEKGVYIAFWTLGAGILLSWNALICSFPLMATFFAEESVTRTNLASYLSSVFCFANFLFLGLAQRDVSSTPPSPRLHFALLLLLGTCFFLTVPVIPTLNQLHPSNAITFPILCIFTVLLAISTSYLQSAVVALASLWGSKEVLAVMSGQGGIAVLVSGAQVILAIISSLAPTPADTPSGDDAGGGGDGQSAVGLENQSMLAVVGLWALAAMAAGRCMYAHRYLVQHPDYTIALGPVLARQHRGAGGRKRDDDGLSMAIFWKNLPLNVAVAWVFVITLSVFPPITTTITSVRSIPPRLLRPDIFIPLHFLLFNVGDFIGRTYLPSITALLITAPRKVLFLSLSRTLYIPLFLACNVTSGSTSSPMINSDTLYFLILFSFGLTNGYISSLSMIVASSPDLNPRISDAEKDVAGTLAAFCLVAGLAGGSVLSFGVNWLVRGNPFA